MRCFCFHLMPWAYLPEDFAQRYDSAWRTAPSVWGFGLLVANFSVGNAPSELTCRSMTLFAQEVMPKLQHVNSDTPVASQPSAAGTGGVSSRILGTGAIDMTCRDETIMVRKREVRLVRGGQGQPLLFLHDPWTYRWLPVHDRLAERYQVIMPIHPGFAGTQGFEEMDRIEDLVFHYLDVCEVLRLEQPILMGASLGGWIAAEFAIRYSGLLRALILGDALGLRVPGAPATDLFLLDPAQLRAAIFADPTVALAYEVIPNTPPLDAIEALLKARQTLARFAWQFPDNPKLASDLYRVKCPTFVVWGAQDGVVPVAHAQRYWTEIAAAEHAVLPSCGHLPHLERSEALATKVLEHLERVGAKASHQPPSGHDSAMERRR